MESRESSAREYVLGSHAQELARLDAQARQIEPATRLLLLAAGIGSGARVLDLGTGLGHVAQLVAGLIGPSGSVVGLDRSPGMLEEARRRVGSDARIVFTQGDVTSWRDAEPFDVIVGRLLLFHVADPIAVVRHHLAALRPGGQFIAIDFDIGSARTEPAVPLLKEALEWISAAFSAAGASPNIGARLGVILADAGLTGVTTFGVQGYIPPQSPAGPALVAGVIRSLEETIVARRIATREQIGIETLESRIADALHQANAVLLPPTVSGAWGRRP
jgi:SAM-dependent methyltransferase